MRILIAGGTGDLGSHTVPRLVEAGHEVIAVSRREQSDQELRAAGADPVRLDLFDLEDVVRAADGADAVVNLATRIPSAPGALMRRAWRANDRLRSEAAGIMAGAAAGHGARFVQESFAPAYPDCGEDWIAEERPLGPVAQTRTVPVAEGHALRMEDTDGVGVVLRFGVFYGPRSPQTRSWLDAARTKGRLMLPGPADHYTSMIRVDDAAAAVVAALSVPAGVYNVVEDEPLNRDEHAAVLGELLGRKPLKLLPTAMGHIPTMKVLARSHRVSNRKLREASEWAPLAPSVREGWPQVLGELEAVGS